MATKQELEKVEAGGLPAGLDDYGEDSGGGMENLDPEELRVPFIRVLQSNSPQVDASKGGAVVEGARPGMLCHMGTLEVWPGDGSVEFVTAYRERDFVEWTPYDQGGGFIARRAWDDPDVAALRARQGRFGKLTTSDGSEIVQTFYLYGLLLPPAESPRRVVVALTSTQIKKYQAVIDRVEAVKFVKDGRVTQPPLYAWRWKIWTGPEKNKSGSWFGINFQPAGEDNLRSLLKRSDPLYATARDFYELLKTGTATADTSQLAREGDVDDAPPLDEPGRDAPIPG